MAVQSYQELEVWKVAMDLATECYRVTKAFPKDELFGMTSQIRRSAASIPANIAEGQGREHKKEFLSYVSIARGSLKELETHLLLLSARRIAQGSRSTVSDDVVRPDQPDALTSPPGSRTKALTPHASRLTIFSGSAIDAAPSWVSMA